MTVLTCFAFVQRTQVPQKGVLVTEMTIRRQDSCFENFTNHVPKLILTDYLYNKLYTTHHSGFAPEVLS